MGNVGNGKHKILPEKGGFTLPLLQPILGALIRYQVTIAVAGGSVLPSKIVIFSNKAMPGNMENKEDNQKNGHVCCSYISKSQIQLDMFVH